MQSCWIIGAGHFGRRALAALGRKYPEATITVIDREAAALRGAPELSEVEFLCAEAMDYLAEHLGPGQPKAQWIVPAIPVHVAYEWIIRRLAAEGFRTAPLAVPEAVIGNLPNVFRGEDGAIYASNADFLCPENCPEPEDICTHTGKPRPCNLYEKLGSLQAAPFRPLVVRSLQLAPGVGGYRPEALFHALAAVKQADGPILLSTACRCHGVMHAFTVLSGSDL